MPHHGVMPPITVHLRPEATVIAYASACQPVEVDEGTAVPFACPTEGERVSVDKPETSPPQASPGGTAGPWTLATQHNLRGALSRASCRAGKSPQRRTTDGQTVGTLSGCRE